MADHWIGRFTAMASPCEVLVETSSHKEAAALLELISSEAWRIEEKFSRYLKGNIVHQINTANGAAIEVDEESARLLDYAAVCYELSDGAFDVTSGILRRVWKFDGSDRLPDPASVAQLLPRIGWNKVVWNKPRITLQPDMELDLGGLGKEYAVDAAATLLEGATQASFVVNFGGDLFVSSLRANGEPWRIGLDDPLHTGENAVGQLQIERGGVATSGDARRFLLHDGKRYGHILNPLTGWPVEGAPRSIMVVAETCVEAGMFATMAMLRGPEAEAFLDGEEVKYWCER